VLANLTTQSTGNLWLGGASLLISWVPVAWITVDHLVTPIILDARGVTVEAVVDDRFYGRVNHSLDVHTLEGPQFSTTLDHWPRDLEVGDTFDLTYDPQQPNRAAAEGTPWVDGTVIQFAPFALLILPCGLLLVPVAPELAPRTAIVFLGASGAFCAVNIPAVVPRSIGAMRGGQPKDQRQRERDNVTEG
jgi:hypothetical protein